MQEGYALLILSGTFPLPLKGSPSLSLSRGDSPLFLFSRGPSLAHHPPSARLAHHLPPSGRALPCSPSFPPSPSLEEGSHLPTLTTVPSKALHLEEGPPLTLSGRVLSFATLTTKPRKTGHLEEGSRHPSFPLSVLPSFGCPSHPTMFWRCASPWCLWQVAPWCCASPWHHVAVFYPAAEPCHCDLSCVAPSRVLHPAADLCPCASPWCGALPLYLTLVLFS